MVLCFPAALKTKPTLRKEEIVMLPAGTISSRHKANRIMFYEQPKHRTGLQELMMWLVHVIRLRPPLWMPCINLCGTHEHAVEVEQEYVVRKLPDVS